MDEHITELLAGHLKLMQQAQSTLLQYTIKIKFNKAV